ncbi:MAG: oligosaccharide flippase family protein [Candidatus Krumholzibacteriota bacterium]|nr:oligosaccharide flippase family protein [Candidatus Krumholzibacteriota bacterium]
MARALGPEIRGYYGLTVMAASMIASLGHFGLGTAITYFTGKKTYANSDILAFFTLVAFFIGSFFAILMYLIYPHLPNIWTEISKPVMITGLIAAPFILFHNYFLRFLFALMRVKESNIAKLFLNLSYLILIIILVLIRGGSLKETILAFTLSTIVASVLSFVFFTGDMRKGWRINSTMFGPMFNMGARAYMLSVFSFINFRLDLFLIKYFLTASDVSYYSIAVNVSERLWYVPNAIGAVLFPTLLSMNKGSSEFTAKVCRNNFFIMIVLGVAILISAKFLIVFMYGKEYESVSLALYSILWGIVIFPVYRFLSIDFASKNRLGLSVGASFIGIAVNLAANIYMIPRFGIVGAGISTSLSYSVLSIILMAIFKKENGLPLRDLFIPKRQEFIGYRNGAVKAWKIYILRRQN